MNILKNKRFLCHLRVMGVTLGLHLLMLLLAALFTAQSPAALFSSRLLTPGDAVRYLDLAQNGYVTNGENQINLVFYPLYPWLMRLLSCLTLGNLQVSGVLISWLCCMGASVLLYELILMEGDQRQADLGVLLFSLYPFSMFLLGVYTESLFLFLSLGCMLTLRKKRMLPAGILGFLAALTRVQGMLLLLPAVCELLLARFGQEKRKLRGRDGFVLLIPMGFLVYLGINAFLWGDPFKFLEFEAGEPWYQTARWVGENISLQWALAKDYAGLAGIIYLPQIALYFLSVCILFWGIRKKVPLPYLIYGGAYLGFTYLSGWMISGGRYMLCCFPLFMILSRVKSDTARGVLICLEALLFFAYSLFFLMGYAIM